MTELRKQINNIVEDHQACLTLAKSMNGNEVYEGTTATAEDIAIGKTAYSNGELIEGTLEGTNNNVLLQTNLSNGNSSVSGIQIMLKEINGDFTTTLYTLQYLFYHCVYMEKITGTLQTSGVREMQHMFNDCASLVDFPMFDTSSATNMTNMFYKCTSLSEVSLNNILQMCINATKISTKTLKYIGLTSTQATKCQTLPNYQAFLDAGWTTGY